MDGLLALHFVALIGISFASTALGCFLNLVTGSSMQALAMAGPLQLILLLTSGYFFGMNDLKEFLRLISSATPSYAAQTIVDTAFVYRRPWEEIRSRDHRISAARLNTAVKDLHWENDMVDDLRPATSALVVLLSYPLLLTGTAMLLFRRRKDLKSTARVASEV